MKDCYEISKKIKEIGRLDLDEEDNKVLQELVTLKNRVKSELAHGSWLTNAARVIAGKQITHSSRKRLLTLIRTIHGIIVIFTPRL